MSQGVLGIVWCVVVTSALFYQLTIGVCMFLWLSNKPQLYRKGQCMGLRNI